jgi:hypothetical protein
VPHVDSQARLDEPWKEAYMRKLIAAGFVIGALLALVAGPASAKEFGSLYHDGELVRTFGAPAALPHGGIDPLYSVTNGVGSQVDITAVAPGDKGYHGGRWAVYTVTFSEGVAPYLLTSDEAVLAAESAGDVTVTRTPDGDNRCPVLP